MNGYTVQGKENGVVHVRSLVIETCPAQSRYAGTFEKYAVRDNAASALHTAEMLGKVCKFCRKELEAIIDGTPASRPAPQDGETPSLEEIADEAPITTPAVTVMTLGGPVIMEKESIRTREEWLIQAVAMLSRVFEAQGFKVPPVRISVGWPGGKSKKGLHTTIGQCWHSATDGVPQIFISPKLTDTAEILATIMHELVHAVDGGKSQHKAGFKRIAVLVGLAGKMTATHAGETLRKVFPAILDALGKYDHAELEPGTLIDRVQTNKHLKIVCVACGFASRATAKQLDTFGISQHCGEDMEEA